MKKNFKKGKQQLDEDVKAIGTLNLTLADLPFVEKEKVAKLAENVSPTCS